MIQTDIEKFHMEAGYVVSKIVDGRHTALTLADKKRLYELGKPFIFHQQRDLDLVYHGKYDITNMTTNGVITKFDFVKGTNWIVKDGNIIGEYYNNGRHPFAETQLASLKKKYPLFKFVMENVESQYDKTYVFTGNGVEKSKNMPLTSIPYSNTNRNIPPGMQFLAGSNYIVHDGHIIGTLGNDFILLKDKVPGYPYKILTRNEILDIYYPVVYSGIGSLNTYVIKGTNFIVKDHVIIGELKYNEVRELDILSIPRLQNGYYPFQTVSQSDLDHIYRYVPKTEPKGFENIEEDEKIYVLDYIIHDGKIVAKLDFCDDKMDIFPLSVQDCGQLKKDSVPYTYMGIIEIKKLLNITEYEEVELLSNGLKMLKGTQFVLASEPSESKQKRVVGYQNGFKVVSLDDRQVKILKSLSFIKIQFATFSQKYLDRKFNPEDEKIEKTGNSALNEIFKNGHHYPCFQTPSQVDTPQPDTPIDIIYTEDEMCLAKNCKNAKISGQHSLCLDHCKCLMCGASNPTEYCDLTIVCDKCELELKSYYAMFKAYMERRFEERGMLSWALTTLAPIKDGYEKTYKWNEKTFKAFNKYQAMLKIAPFLKEGDEISLANIFHSFAYIDVAFSSTKPIFDVTNFTKVSSTIKNRMIPNDQELAYYIIGSVIGFPTHV